MVCIIPWKFDVGCFPFCIRQTIFKPPHFLFIWFFATTNLIGFHKLVLIVRVSEHHYHCFLELWGSFYCPSCPTGCQSLNILSHFWNPFLHEKFNLNHSMPKHDFRNFWALIWCTADLILGSMWKILVHVSALCWPVHQCSLCMKSDFVVLCWSLD